MSNKIRFAYLRNDKGIPFACVAYEFGKGFMYSTSYGVSVLNSRDGDKWDRKMARLIAAGHLAVDGNYARLDRNIESNNEVLVAVMNDIANNSKLPSKARRGASKWMLERSMNKVRLFSDREPPTHRDYDRGDHINHISCIVDF